MQEQRGTSIASWASERNGGGGGRGRIFQTLMQRNSECRLHYIRRIRRPVGSFVTLKSRISPSRASDSLHCIILNIYARLNATRLHRIESSAEPPVFIVLSEILANNDSHLSNGGRRSTPRCSCNIRRVCTGCNPGGPFGAPDESLRRRKSVSDGNSSNGTDS